MPVDCPFTPSPSSHSSCAAFLVLRQKPFSASGPSSPPLGLPQISSCARFALLSLLTSLTWFYGLTLCGPLRAVLVTEHSPAALLAGLAAVFCGSGGAAANSNFSRARGAFFFALGTLALLLVDHDDNSPHHQVRKLGAISPFFVGVGGFQTSSLSKFFPGLPRRPPGAARRAVRLLRPRLLLGGRVRPQGRRAAALRRPGGARRGQVGWTPRRGCRRGRQEAPRAFRGLRRRPPRALGALPLEGLGETKIFFRGEGRRASNVEKKNYCAILLDR